jgi:ribosome biogenesis protein BRX1
MSAPPPPAHPKHKVLLVTSRGVNERIRHLHVDLQSFLTHHKSENKIDAKAEPATIAEIAEMRNCDVALYLEARKHIHAYLWIGSVPGGPTVKFQLHNIHTMAELKMPGNCVQGARPVVSFDASFDASPTLQISKELFKQAFAVPYRHHKSLPFTDHVITFTATPDGLIHFRMFQAVPPESGRKDEQPTLLEIGPRFSLEPIFVLDGSFSGNTVWRNPDYVSPSQKTAGRREELSQEQTRRAEAKTAYDQRDRTLEADEVDAVFGDIAGRPSWLPDTGSDDEDDDETM